MGHRDHGLDLRHLRAGVPARHRRRACCMVGKDARLTGLAVCRWALAAGVAAAQSLPLVVDGGCREGLPHGRYELRTATGALRVAGAFNHGKRTGSFLFWSASGSRVAHLPYDDDARNGTLAT